MLHAYVTGYLTAARAGEAAPPHMLSVVWSTIRWPVFAVLMGFTGLGLLGIPVLFSIRGFLLSFAITSFVRMFGGVGGVLAFLTFGVTGLVAIPVLFVLGVQSLWRPGCWPGDFWETASGVCPLAGRIGCGAACAAPRCVCVRCWSMRQCPRWSGWWPRCFESWSREGIGLDVLKDYEVFLTTEKRLLPIP